MFEGKARGLVGRGSELKGQSGSRGGLKKTKKKKNGCLGHRRLRQRDLGVVFIICRKLNQVKSGQKAGGGGKQEGDQAGNLL